MIKNYIEPSGQRNAVLIDSETRIPKFWPALYCSSQLRTKGVSHNTLKSHLGAINCLYKWAEMRNIDIYSRISSGKGFSRNEIDTLITLLRSRIRDLSSYLSQPSTVININSTRRKSSVIWQTLEEQPRQINPSTYNDRLKYVGNYISWLCDYMSDQDDKASRDTKYSIVAIGSRFKATLFSLKSVEPNTTFENPKSLSNKDIRTVITLTTPNNSLNPWKQTDTKIRNFAIICILLDTGLRSGELLSLKLQDIIFAKKRAKGLKVRRRQGSKDDPRLTQPSTKRDEREVPLSEAAFKALNLYVSSVRNETPSASQTEYLFVSVSNRDRGLPLSSITSITNGVRDVSGIDLTPHKLRHTATWRFCVSQKKQGKEWGDFVEQLILKFGWRNPDSPTVRHYAKRFIKDQSFERAIHEQDKLSSEMLAASKAAKMELKHGK